MKIVLLSDRIPPENVGGAGRVTWALATGLRAAGHDIHVIAATSGQPFEEVRDGIPTYHLHAQISERWRYWLSVYNPQTIAPLRALLLRLHPDVVNAHNVHHDLSWSSLSVAHQLGIPTVFTAHDMMAVAYGKLVHFIDPHIDPAQHDMAAQPEYRLPRGYNLRQMRLRYNPFRNPLIRRILRHDTARRTCVSQAHGTALDANGLPSFEVVYNGVDPSPYEIPQSAIDAYRTTLENRPTILFAGRLSREKGGALLLKAFAQVIERVPSALLLVLAPESRVLDRLLTGRAALRESIRFGGWLNGAELNTAFCAADVVAVPSIFFESFGMVAAEAMAASKPVVASCFGGLPELVKDGETGYLVNPYDTPALVDRLTRLLTDPVLAERMGAAGRRRLIEHFTLERQVHAMETIYTEAMRV